MNNDLLEVKIGTSLDTTKAQKALKDFKKTAETTTKINFEGLEVFKTITTYVDNAGNSIQRLTRSLKEADGSLIPITDEVSKISTKLKDVNKSTVETSREVNKFRNETGGLTTVIREVNAQGEKFTTTIKETNNGIGRITKSTEVYNDTLQKTVSKHTETISDQAKVVDGIKKEQEALEKSIKKKIEDANASQKASNANKKFGQSFSDIITKVTKFYLASLPIRVVQTMITNATEAVKEFDKAFTELAKVSSLSGDSLKEYADTLADIGTEVARTKTEMVQIATELTKAGNDPQDVEILSELVALYQNTADEELSAADATSVLVSQMKAFDIEAEEAIHITDAINQVSQDFAVSSGDIGRGLTQAGAALSTYGNSFDQTIGLITAGTEIFQGKSQQVTICGLLNIA